MFDLLINVISSEIQSANSINPTIIVQIPPMFDLNFGSFAKVNVIGFANKSILCKISSIKAKNIGFNI